MKKSVQNKLFLEPYKGKGKIEATVKSGFATVAQRTNLVGLKLLVTAKVMVGQEVEELTEGTLVYFEEKVLATAPWAKQTYSADGFIDKDFIMADYHYAVGVKAELPPATKVNLEGYDVN